MPRTKEEVSELSVVPEEEVLPSSFTPTMSLDELRVSIENEKEKRQMLLGYAESQMKLGTDYYDIQGKKSLGKPGAEKFCALFNVTIGEPTLAGDIMDSLPEKVLEQGVTVLRTTLYRGGQVIGSGIGARSLSQDRGDINKTMKMARKSSVIDAVISTFGLSDLFTQDIEDMSQSEIAPAAERVRDYAPAPSQDAQDATFTVETIEHKEDKSGRLFALLQTDIGPIYDFGYGQDSYEAGCTYKADLKTKSSGDRNFTNVVILKSVLDESGEELPF